MSDFKPRGGRIAVPITAQTPLQVSGESVSIPAGAAGAVVNFYIAKKPILDDNNSWIGGYGDSSLDLTSTTFDNEVSPYTEDADLSNGDYWIDYITGRGRGKKKDTATSMTADYYIFLNGLAAGGTIFGDLDIEGDLTVTGNFNFGDAGTDILTIYGYIQGHASGKTYVSIGTGTPGNLGTPQTDDAYIKGRLEVDGVLYPDAGITLGGNLDVNSQVITGYTASRALATDGSGNIIVSSVTSTELGYVSGVTSAIQTQLGNKLENVVEDTTPQLGGNLDVNGNNITGYTASRAVITDGSGNIGVSSVTGAELGYVSGVTSAIQTQINGKIANVVEDTTPQLGGDLDVNGNAIVSVSDGDIDITPDGTGEVNINGTIAVGNLEMPEDGGIVQLATIPVTATPAAGTLEGYTFDVDGFTVLTIEAEADSAGSISNRRVIVEERLEVKSPSFYDEMWTDLAQEWATRTTTGSAAAQNAVNGWHRLTTGAVATNEESLDWNDICPFVNTRRPTFETRIQLEQITNMEVEVGLIESSGVGTDDYIRIYFDASAGTPWNLEASTGGSTTSDAGSDATTDEVKLRFEFVSDTEVEWYIDDVLQGSVATNVPTVQLQPYMAVRTEEGSAHYIDIDYVKIWQDRS